MRFHSEPDRFRQTGRTTEMLKKALQSVDDGHRVVVFMLTQNEIYYAQGILRKLVKNEPSENIKFLACSQVAWHTLSPCPDDAVVYFDHRANERMTYEQYQVLVMRRFIK